MKKIVLTGGPCSGKTTTLAALRQEFGENIMVVPEVATMLLSSGFPVPGRDCDWSQEWQDVFQSAIVALQQSMETAYFLVAKAKGIKMLVCDRGLLDGAAYTPGGLQEFCAKHGVDENEALASYDEVIHLESLATACPEKYGKVGNDHRFEPLERAQELERNTRAAWVRHSCHRVISGDCGIDRKISEVVAIVRDLT